MGEGILHADIDCANVRSVNLRAFVSWYKLEVWSSTLEISLQWPFVADNRSSHVYS